MKLDYSKDAQFRKNLFKSIWSSTINVLENFTESYSIFTHSWILEIFDILSKKFSSNEIISEGYGTFSKVLINSISFLSAFASGGINIGLKDVLVAGTDFTPKSSLIYELDAKYGDKLETIGDDRQKIIHQMLTPDIKDEEECKK